jgi:hypothetical protein
MVSEPESGRYQGYGGHEVAGEFVEAGRYPSEVFELVEVSLHEVAHAVEFGVDGSRDANVALAGDVSRRAAVGTPVDQCFGAIAAVGDNVGSERQAFEKGRCRRLVGGLSGRDDEAERQPNFVHDGVELCRQSSTRTANGVIRTPLFPPAACWWAFTMELSISWSAAGSLAASASKTASQTPRLAHLLYRL